MTYPWEHGKYWQLHLMLKNVVIERGIEICRFCTMQGECKIKDGGHILELHGVEKRIITFAFIYLYSFFEAP